MTFGLAAAGVPDAEKTIERVRNDPDAFAFVNQAAAVAAQMSRAMRDRGREK